MAFLPQMPSLQASSAVPQGSPGHPFSDALSSPGRWPLGLRGCHLPPHGVEWPECLASETVRLRGEQGAQSGLCYWRREADQSVPLAERVDRRVCDSGWDLVNRERRTLWAEALGLRLQLFV